MILIHRFCRNKLLMACGLCLMLLLAELLVGSSCALALDMRPKLSLEFKDTDIRDVLKGLGIIAGVNIVTDSTVDGKVTVKLSDMELVQALQAVLRAGGYRYQVKEGVYLVSRNSFPEETLIEVDQSGRVSVTARDSDLRQLLLDVSKKSGVSVVPAANILSTVSVELKGVQASDIVSVLAKAGGALCSEQNGVWYVEPNIPKPDPAAIAKAASGGNEKRRSGGVVTRALSLKYLKASDAVEYLGKPGQSGGSGDNAAAPTIRATKEENILLVTGTEEAIERVQEGLDQIDVAAPQVMLEARLVEVFNTKDKSLGLLLGKYSDNKTSVDVVQGQITYASGGFTTQLNAILRNLVERGDAKVIATPSICAITGHEASIDIGQVRYFKITNYDNQPAGQGAYYPYTTLQTVSAGIMLKITPWVGASGEITAQIQPEVSSVTGVTADGLPEINRRKASTTIRVRDGDTIVIGGLKQQERNKTVTSTPILSEIPVLGQLFRNTKVTNRESELLIFITPKILSSNESAGNTGADDDKEALVGKAK